jgi:hypothetical protein
MMGDQRGFNFQQLQLSSHITTSTFSDTAQVAQCSLTHRTFTGEKERDEGYFGKLIANEDQTSEWYLT